MHATRREHACVISWSIAGPDFPLSHKGPLAGVGAAGTAGAGGMQKEPHGAARDSPHAGRAAAGSPAGCQVGGTGYCCFLRPVVSF